MCNLYICFPVKGHRKTAIKNTESHLNKESQSIWNNSLDYSKLRSSRLSLNYIHKLCLITRIYISKFHWWQTSYYGTNWHEVCALPYNAYSRWWLAFNSNENSTLISLSEARQLISPTPLISLLSSLSCCCSICMAGWSKERMRSYKIVTTVKQNQISQDQM